MKREHNRAPSPVFPSWAKTVGALGVWLFFLLLFQIFREKFPLRFQGVC